MDRCLFTAGHIHPAVEETRHRLLPPGSRPLRLLFVSDIHLRASMDPEALAAQMAAQTADCVLLGGDLSDDLAQAERLLSALQILRPPLGLYAAPGNNDPEAYGSLDAFRRALSRIGCRLLVNETVRTGGLTISGLDEYKYGSPDASGLFRASDRVRILLSHFPVWPDLPKALQPQLMLCGHTHGGQYDLLGINPYTIGFELKYHLKGIRLHHVSGWMRQGGTNMLVSKGIGMSRIPLRVGVRSEMHLIRLEPQTGRDES